MSALAPAPAPAPAPAHLIALHTAEGPLGVDAELVLLDARFPRLMLTLVDVLHRDANQY